ncbi:MAG: hypothetical protein FGM24_08740 [Candidatus Kapabacteria bacterium]|nr:hypothetical protein [Candidatus Kapabacteria bacterium]
MRTELRRTMTELGTRQQPPYFVAYAITETRTTSLAASFGAMDIDRHDVRRVMDVDVRVGTHDLDNTRSIRGVAFEIGRGGRNIAVPLQADAPAIRTLLWSATDRVYRDAIERFGKVTTNRQVKVREEDTSADLSREIAYTHYDADQPFVFDTTGWRSRVRALSAMCAGHANLLQGRVTFQADYVIKWFANSDGSSIRVVEPIVKMFVIVKSKADDGMSLPLYKSYTAFHPDRLPSEATMRNDVQQMIDLCLQLRAAPLMETYTGPAILSGRSSGVFFHEIFGHRVEGHRQKDANSSQTFKPFLNKRILPDFIDVVFDPTISTLAGEDIVGFYRFDDEGIPGKAVNAVEKGVFKGFLMSRSPIDSFPISNGHGRRQAGYRPVSRQSNLIVRAARTVPYDSLRALLRSQCRAQGKEFGLLFDDIQGGFTFTGRTVPNAFNVQPLVVYKIFADGRPDELVRGVDLIGTPLTTFNNIVAAADDMGIFNGVCGAESGGVPVSASSPSILVSTIEVQKKQKSQAKPPLLGDPTIRTGGQP